MTRHEAKNRLRQLAEALFTLPFSLNDKWLSEAALATQQTVALELSNEETRRRRAAPQSTEKGILMAPSCATCRFSTSGSADAKLAHDRCTACKRGCTGGTAESWEAEPKLIDASPSTQQRNATRKPCADCAHSNDLPLRQRCEHCWNGRSYTNFEGRP